ncbi:hypothetical protein PFICI_03720 [Pestalotiopsis fici W106-1]|uniref:Uncharacterized protein n=1 Tax=Pestalotiopsis fici (strain W106-1 / CGMCC3.15140) TaxID=1229662 RepID=W3XI47_PESFW|nr:uncharacterized protein PFICI_03720 [Pestalotiopsis fici W106-1]ETS85695.1 hypothetical protein PFICI_03720 [Pestalotiopsis fici W106-1]
MAADDQDRPWSFDVSSLMILISEDEEINYRLSQRSLVQCLVATPVVGLQSYLRNYNFLSETASLVYFLPYGVNAAQLGNMRLHHAIRYGKLLKDGTYTVLKIPAWDHSHSISATRRICPAHVLLVIWTMFTWIFLAGVLVFLNMVKGITWIGISTCTSFIGWSIILRLVEYLNIEHSPSDMSSVAEPNARDAAFIIGRANSAVVLEGSRRDIRDWTAQGPTYKSKPWGVSAVVWQAATRTGTVFMLLAIFCLVPNGSTMDQVAFIIINFLAQVNVVAGQRLNSRCYLSQLEQLDQYDMPTRTHVYAALITRYKELVDKNKDWVRALGILPQTDEWNEWKDLILSGSNRDPKELYKSLLHKPKAKTTNSP